MVFPVKHYLQRKTLMTPCHHQPDPDPIQEMQKSAAEARNKNRSALCFGRLEAVGDHGTWGFPLSWWIPNSWMVSLGKSQSKMDDN